MDIAGDGVGVVCADDDVMAVDNYDIIHLSFLPFRPLFDTFNFYIAL